MTSANRVKESTTSTSTSTISLAGASPGFRTFAAKFASGATINDVMVGPDSTGAWLLGDYTINGSTLTRIAIVDSSADGADVTLAAGAKDVFATASAQTISGVRDISFSAAVPLSLGGTSFMQAQTVASVLAFTVAPNPVRGALAFVRLIADGINAPTFSGMKEWNGSSGYDNRNGIVNVVQFFCDGVDVWFSIAQAVGATPVAAKPGAPSIGSASAGDGTASVSFTAPASNGGATITGYTVTAYKSSDNSVVGTVNVTASPANFTGLANGVAVYFKAAATNSAGTGLQSAASNTVTPAVAAVTYTRLNNLSKVTETGTGPYSYAGIAGSAYNGDQGGVSPKLAAGKDGSIAYQINSLSGASFLLCASTGSAKVSYAGTFIALYPDVNNFNYYTTITDGNAGGRVATTYQGQDGDIMRLRRVGTRFIAEVARANDPTNFVAMRNFDNTNTGDVYFQVDVAGATSIAQNVTGVGLS